ncbi:hypothetical protein DWW90_09015 [Parabacteroides sp. AF17-28]|nr:hypothetical protein DWW90_09015 [Parabacteroides sp. AF17-28]
MNQDFGRNRKTAQKGGYCNFRVCFFAIPHRSAGTGMVYSFLFNNAKHFAFSLPAKRHIPLRNLFLYDLQNKLFPAFWSISELYWFISE